MRALGHQKGMGILGLLIIAVMVGFFVMSAIRIAPGYFEYLSVRDIVIRVAGEYREGETTIADIRRSLAGYFNTNQVKGIDYREVDIVRDEGQTIINSSYEDRIPLLWRIDAVVKYDDLVFIAGEDYSD
ncbi:MAG: hypothetical protein ACI87W_002739 [Halieaceae bacterium]|jgi:hypothetical protein